MIFPLYKCFNTIYPNISMHILHAILCMSPMVLVTLGSLRVKIVYQALKKCTCMYLIYSDYMYLRHQSTKY